jgi:hypothetical protein
LHFIGEDVGFVDFQIIDTVPGIVRLHPSIDRFPQSERRVSLRAHVAAVAQARGAQLKTGDDTSVITDCERNVVRSASRLRISIEIAVLKDEPMTQDSRSLLDDCFLGGPALSRISLAPVVDIQARPESETY